jgi:hypothetical protein
LRVLVAAVAGAACVAAGATAGPVAFATESGLPLAEINLRGTVGLGLSGGAFGALLAAPALWFIDRKRLWLAAAVADATTWLGTFVVACRCATE